MRRLGLVLILLIAVRAFGVGTPSTTFLWSPVAPTGGIGSAYPGTDALRCNAWVPELGITSATQLAWYVVGGLGGGGLCAVAIYNADGSVRLMSSGAVNCAASGAKMMGSLAPHTFTEGTKYQVCVCANTTGGSYLTTDTASSALTDLENVFSVPIGADAANPCVSGVPPATTGVLTATATNAPIVLLATAGLASTTTTSTSLTTTSTTTTTTTTTTITTTTTTGATTTTTTATTTTTTTTIDCEAPPSSPNVLDDEFNDNIVDDNASCTGSAAPLACCTGTGTGTCRWSWINQGGSTITETGTDHTTVVTPADGSTNARVRVQSIGSLTPPYTVTMHLACTYTSSNFTGCGIMLRNSTSGRLLSLGSVFSTFNGNDVSFAANWSSPTAGSGVVAQGAQTAYYRITVTSSTVITFDRKVNANDAWTSYGVTEDPSAGGGINGAGGTIDQIGFETDTSNSNATTGTYYWFRVNFTCP